MKAHLQAIACLQDNIESIKEIASNLPDSTLKGRILASTDCLETTADQYADQTIGLYEQMLSFAMRAAV